MSGKMRRFHGTTVAGILLVLLGGLWILSNLDYLDFKFRDWWPLILIVVGLISLIGGRTMANPGGWILMVLGGLFLLVTNDVVAWSQIWKFWPAILIVFGISIIFKWHGGHRPKSSGENEIGASVIFGGIEKKITSKNFKGGSISTLFGGADIDLRSAELDEQGAVMDISTMFGGVDLRIPESWPIEIHSSAIFGGIGNKSKNELKKSDRRLVIKSSAIFGGIDIKN